MPPQMPPQFPVPKADPTPLVETTHTVDPDVRKFEIGAIPSELNAVSTMELSGIDFPSDNAKVEGSNSLDLQKHNELTVGLNGRGVRDYVERVHRTTLRSLGLSSASVDQIVTNLGGSVSEFEATLIYAFAAQMYSQNQGYTVQNVIDFVRGVTVVSYSHENSSSVIVVVPGQSIPRGSQVIPRRQITTRQRINTRARADFTLFGIDFSIDSRTITDIVN